jgi:hypothetical protein
MLYIDFNAGGKDYKLRLNTRALITLEKDLNKNPIYIFLKPEDIKGIPPTPTIEEMVFVLHNSLKAYHPEINLEQTFDIFDEWVADGHLVGEFTNVIMDVYKLSGLFKKEDHEGKN